MLNCILYSPAAGVYGRRIVIDVRNLRLICGVSSLFALKDVKVRLLGSVVSFTSC
jgi:hypothetical protein